RPPCHSIVVSFCNNDPDGAVAPPLSLHDALPIWIGVQIQPVDAQNARAMGLPSASGALVSVVTPDSPADKAGVEVGDVITAFGGDRKSTRLNSSHVKISYAAVCLKKKISRTNGLS